MKPGCYRLESGDVLVVYKGKGRMKTDTIDQEIWSFIQDNLDKEEPEYPAPGIYRNEDGSVKVLIRR